MAIARKCDRCGAYHDGLIYKVTVEVPPAYVLRGEEEFTKDLCRQCLCDYIEFLNGEKPKTLIEKLKDRKKHEEKK